MTEPFILCEGLVKIYQVADLEMVALQGLNISVERGEIIGVVGASGSGKSTLMNVLGGLDRPTAGRVIVNGKNLLRLPDRELNRYRREEVGFVWQQSTRNLVPYLNAIQNVMLPMMLAGANAKENRSYAAELLRIVGLADRQKHHLPELSGGEQQRVAIAVALANRPSLLLADEPTGEVDSVTAQGIYATFRMLAKELTVTTVIVSHDPTIAHQVDRVVHIRDGMLAAETRRQVRKTPNEETNGDDRIEEAEDEYEELIVLDKAGCMHIPQEYLEQLSFKNHAQIEVTDEGILLRPFTESDAATSTADTESDKVALVAAEPGKVRRLLGRFRRKKSNYLR